MFAAVYTRVSTQGQADHGYSLEDQEKRCSARAKELGATDLRIYTDAGESASTDDRPALSQLRSDLRTGGIDLVVILDPDRLARKLAHQLIITEEIERQSRLEFVNFEWRNTPDGRLFYSLRGAIAEFEREKIRERSMRGREAKARTGKVIAGGWYGYTKQGDSWEPGDYADVVRQMYRWVAEERLTPSQVAARLASQGLPGPKGGHRWYGSVVLSMLRNPAYIGVVFNLRERVRRQVKHWDELLKFDEQQLPGGLKPVHITPIVDEDLWNAAQRVLDTLRVRNRKITDTRGITLLSGLLICGVCGSHMSGVSAVSGGKRYRYYRCNRWWSGKFEQGVESSIVQCRVRGYGDQLDTLVWQEVIKILNHPERVLGELEASEAQGSAAIEKARLQKQLDWWEGKRTRTVRAFTAGWLGEDEARQEIATCDREIRRCRSELETALSPAQGLEYVRDHFTNMQEFCAHLIASAEGADIEKKRAILRTLVERVVFSGSELTIVGRFDPQALHGAAVPFVAAVAVTSA